MMYFSNTLFLHCYHQFVVLKHRYKADVKVN